VHNASRLTSLFAFPSGIVIDRNNNVYVADASNAIRRIDGATGYVTFITQQKYKFYNLAIDSSGNIFATDTKFGILYKLEMTSDGSYNINPIGETSNLNSTNICQFTKPHGICITSSGDVYFSDYQDGYIGVIQGIAVSRSIFIYFKNFIQLMDNISMFQKQDITIRGTLFQVSTTFIRVRCANLLLLYK